MSTELVITQIADWNEQVQENLSNLLIENVADGASLGFLPPLTQEAATDYWANILAPDVILWVAYWQGELVGTIQLHLSQRQNGDHRAEIARLMVHPTARRKGIGQALLAIAEEKAISENRNLLVLDTRSHDPSNLLYRSNGYIEAGRIPAYARSADGQLDETTFYYKLLANK